MAVCTVCGSTGADDARFCSACGSPLAAGPPAEEQARKTVTVLFADVVGSTELSERLDPETVRQVMASYFQTLRDVLERHGGTVEKFVGDAVMAVFGIPVVHEDDALRAVRAAVGIADSLRRLNGELERRWGSASSCASASTPARSWPTTRRTARGSPPATR
jgi:class 3 adenylate cyclase